MNSPISLLIFTIVLLIILFIIFRELNNWYWKINERVTLQRRTNLLLEEIAMFNYLNLANYTAEVYPGMMPEILNEIASRKYNDSPKGLSSRISILLKIKRVGSKRAWEKIVE